MVTTSLAQVKMVSDSKFLEFPLYLNGALVGTYPGTNMSAPSGTYNLGRCIGDEGTGRQYQGGISSVLFL